MTGYPKSFTLAAGLAFGATAASEEELRIGTASLGGVLSHWAKHL
jgi:hypothetical protein